MTQITMDIARTLAQNWGPGDEVVVSRLDHDADVRPWVIHAERAGATVRWAEFDPTTGEMSPEDVLRHVTPATRLVALTGASNLIGTRPDLAAVGVGVHEHGALFYVDGVHLTAHAPVDVAAIGCDFYACSPYKFLGPTSAFWPLHPICSSPCTPTSCCPRPWSCPSASSSARSPMSSSRA
jgi:selenocysteine lyase/cysteine desulfurase